MDECDAGVLAAERYLHRFPPPIEVSGINCKYLREGYDGRRQSREHLLQYRTPVP